ncbi:MAG: DNA polymerase, partial [Thermomicrobiales bacterium]
LQVHDELVLEVSERDLAETTELLKTTMQGVAQLRVPLLVEASSGPNWQQQEDL